MGRLELALDSVRLYGQELGLEHMDCLEWPTPQDWVCVPTDELHIPSSYNSVCDSKGLLWKDPDELVVLRRRFSSLELYISTSSFPNNR